MVHNLVIYGAGGLAKETYGLIKRINKECETFNLISYVVDDEWFSVGKYLFDIPIRPRNWLIENKDKVVCACAIGYPKDRKKICEMLLREGIKFTNLIHPNAIICEGSQIGNGCIIQNWSVVSQDAIIGNGVFLNDYVTVGHDSVLGDYVTCFSKIQISGGVTVGKGSLIGSMSFISERRKIGDEAVVAPGSIVFTNVKSGTHVLGNPARKIEL